MIIITGPRQIGKSTLVRQALGPFGLRRSSFVATDQPLHDTNDPFSSDVDAIQMEPGRPADHQWLIHHWTKARAKAKALPPGECFVLAIDEIQKIPRWSEIVKGLWDADRAEELPLHVLLLGSSPWLMQKGLSESLAGRYETIHLSHWTYEEMQQAFDVTLDEYIYFGGYPGAASRMREETRWRQYMRDSIITPIIERDILQMTRVDKPALLKRLFELGCGTYSGEPVALNKLLGELQDAGNTVTLSHYLELLSQSWMLTGLQKYTATVTRQRASPPKFNANNTALISALATYSFEQAKSDRSYWGRLVESTVGSYLINHKPLYSQVHYWRESPHEVDFVLSWGDKLLAIEVKSGDSHATPKGLQQFAGKFKQVKPLVVGGKGIPLQEFLLQPIEFWLS